ncbi:eCIS core domain-containing protein [Actinokineospora fastidiosa]|uniref:eCIS core domain-containing protein n=1 Tax=Actinokineospora fastidiosa TaxID=1816 RepID=UPI00166FA0D1|nr:DUF4157 domain-containing protein [Actinokineospora fastidiosa]
MPEVVAGPTAPLPPPPAPRRVRAGLAGESKPLTAATDEFVGEAREPAEPYRAPGWLRHIPEWMKPEAAPAIPSTIPADFPTSIPTAIPTNIPAVLPPLTPPPAQQADPAPRPSPEPPARVAEQGTAPAPPRPLPPRRRSLGQTRRLGLGAPVSRVEPDAPPETPARTGFPYTLDGLRKVDQPPSLAEALAATAEQPPLVHPEALGATAEQPPLVHPEALAATAEQPPLVHPEATPTGSEDRSERPFDRPPAPGEPIVQVTAPADIADDVSRTTGTDVTDVPVFRGPAVDAAARERGARAFARAGAVFLPDAAGPLTAPKARALVAHELVHVAQQRVLGRVPDQGRRLEAEAVAVERRYETTSAAAPELHHPRPAPAPALGGPAQLAVQPTAVQSSHFEQPEREEIAHIAETSAHRVVEQWSHPRLGGGPAPAPAPEFDREARRQELEAEMLDMINTDRDYQNLPPVGHLDQADLERLERRLDREEFTGFRPSPRRSWSAPPPDGVFGDVVQFSEVVGADGRPRPMPSAGAPAPAPARQGRTPDRPRPVEPDDEDEHRPHRYSDHRDRRRADEVDGVFGDVVQFSETVPIRRPDDGHDRAGHGSEQEPIDLDRVDIEELTARLYERLRGRLRLELLVDRERAGLLTDFR